MRCVSLILFLSALSCSLLAEENYPNAKAYLKQFYPNSNIHISKYGAITFHALPGYAFFNTEYSSGLFFRDKREPLLLPPDYDLSDTLSYPFLFYFRYDLDYGKNLPARYFILTEQQMAQFFSNPLAQHESLNFRGLSESNLYLIVQIKNIGPRYASGSLSFPFFDQTFLISVDAEPNMKEFSTHVLPLGRMESKNFQEAEGSPYSLSKLSWDHLSVSLTDEELLEILEQMRTSPGAMPCAIDLSLTEAWRLHSHCHVVQSEK